DRLIAEAVRVIESESAGQPVVLVGHSLGGTLAAIFATLNPERVRGLALLEAPLRFGVGGPGALAALARPSGGPAGAATGPGGAGPLLSLGAVTMAPQPFLLERWADLVASSADAEALLLHQRVERWALDELPMSGRLFDEVVESLYRRDGFM